MTPLNPDYCESKSFRVRFAIFVAIGADDGSRDFDNGFCRRNGGFGPDLGSLDRSSDRGFRHGDAAGRKEEGCEKESKGSGVEEFHRTLRNAE